MRLLLVEDATDLARALTDGFRKHGFVVDACDNGEDALVLATSQPYAAIVLDRMLPKMDGLSVCHALRARRFETPVLLLTARDAVADRVEGLDAGADDYLVKPFAFEELLARTRALTRRTAGTRTNLLRAGDVVLDRTTGRVTRGGAEIVISAKELGVLTALLRYPGRLLTHAQLLDEAWSMDSEISPEVVRAHIKNLRRKLAVEGRPAVIETVHGVGYRVVA